MAGYIIGPCGVLPVAVAAPATTAWNSGDVNPQLTLSPGNLVATNNTGGAFAVVRSVASHTTGKYYCELTATVQNFASFSDFGIANATASLSAEMGSDTNGVRMQGSGQCVLNAVSIGSADGYGVSGQVAGMAIDLTAKLVWFWNSSTARWNLDVLANQNPVGAVGGFSFAGIAAGPYFIANAIWQLNDVTTLNTGATAYSIGTPPTGFGNW